MKTCLINKYLFTPMLLLAASLPVHGQGKPAGGYPADVADGPKAFSIRRPVLEQFVGSWCGYCPDGRAYAEQVAAAVENAIIVELHVSDAMETPESIALSDYYGSAYPQALVDRRTSPISRGTWQASVSNSAQEPAVVHLEFLDLVFDEVSRQVSGTLKATFTSDYNGSIRPNVWVVEDQVVGVGNGYDQVNYDNTTPGHPFQGAGNPIIGYEHNGVVRGMTDGAWGAAGLIPANVSFGESFSVPFAYLVGAGHDETNIRLVGVVATYGPDLADRMILNANESRLPVTMFANGFE